MILLIQNLKNFLSKSYFVLKCKRWRRKFHFQILWKFSPKMYVSFGILSATSIREPYLQFPEIQNPHPSPNIHREKRVWQKLQTSRMLLISQGGRSAINLWKTLSVLISFQWVMIELSDASWCAPVHGGEKANLLSKQPQLYCYTALLRLVQQWLSAFLAKHLTLQLSLVIFILIFLLKGIVH